MNIKLLNVASLIIVSLLVNNTYGQIIVNTNNNAELRISCDEFQKINPPMVTSTCEGEISFSFEDKLYSGGCMGTIERIWTIRDECNNTASFQQFIRMHDKTAPELSEYPENITVNINEIPGIQNISATDNCTQKLNVIFDEKVEKDEAGNTKSIVRNWSVKDKCGNLKTHSQTIIIKKDNS